APGSHCRVSRASPHGGRDGLDAHRGAVRRPRAADAVAGGGPEPRGGVGDGLWAGGGTRGGGFADDGPGVGRLSSSPECARGSARQARPVRGGAYRAGPCSRTDAECPRARITSQKNGGPVKKEWAPQLLSVLRI